MCRCPQCLKIMPANFPQALRELRVFPNGRIGCFDCYDSTDDFYKNGSRPIFENLPKL